MVIHSRVFGLGGLTSKGEKTDGDLCTGGGRVSAVPNAGSAWSKGCNVPQISCPLSQGEHLHIVYIILAVIELLCCTYWY